LTRNGKVYSFGVNNFGQCGVGFKSNTVWMPKQVTGPIEHSSVQSVQLGLQHAYCLDTDGKLYSFGKGDRSQLGLEQFPNDTPDPMPMDTAMRLDEHCKPHYEPLAPVIQVATGMLHGAALTSDNRVFLWGKHILPLSSVPNPERGAVAVDARLPVQLQGLPNVKVEQITCGSHHTAVLLQDGSVWAVGISTDAKKPIHDPVCLIPAGVIELPVRQFQGSMDRTTIVSGDGKLVLQVQLWKDPELQEDAVFTPAWIDRLFEEKPDIRVQQVHRSWIHSMIVTD
jgi:alpha-tubulin suppressor-like RCC1 family protein